MRTVEIYLLPDLLLLLIDTVSTKTKWSRKTEMEEIDFTVMICQQKDLLTTHAIMQMRELVINSCATFWSAL